MSNQEYFFSEVDKKRQSQTKSWTVLVLVLLIIFIVSTYALLKVRNSLRKANFAGWGVEQIIPERSLSNEILDLSATSETEFNLKIDSLKLSLYLNLSDQSFPLQNTYAKIKSDKVVIYGRLKSTRLKLPVTLSMKANQLDGKLMFSNQSTEIEKMFMPTETQEAIVSGINKRLDFDLGLTGKFMVGSIQQSEDQIILTMIRKQ